MAEGRRIVIVGNGEQRQGAAELIDDADLVIRFNDCRSYGQGGHRSDIVVVCNTGRPGRTLIGSQAWRSSDAVRGAREIWSVRDPAKFRDLKPILAESHPDLDDFCDDYTEQFAAYAAETGKVHRVIARSVHEELEQTLAPFNPTPYVVPSTGAVTIAHVLDTIASAKDMILLSGFGHQGWDLHPFAAERLWVEDLVTRGRVQRIETIVAAPEAPYLAAAQ